MQFPAELDNVRTLKKGMKITISVSDENVYRVMKDLYNFMNKPVTVNIDVDLDKQKEILSQISEDQRKKIYALFRDIASFTGDSEENMKLVLKQSFVQDTQWDMFSLSNCEKKLAEDFIEWLIDFCFKMGVPLKESPKDYLDDTEIYLEMCLKYRVCAVCGRPNSDEHHVDAIGMGRDRREYDDSEHEKICLCRVHHTEAETIGWQTFAAKYHVKGIKYTG